MRVVSVVVVVVGKGGSGDGFVMCGAQFWVNPRGRTQEVKYLSIVYAHFRGGGGGGVEVSSEHHRVFALWINGIETCTPKTGVFRSTYYYYYSTTVVG